MRVRPRVPSRRSALPARRAHGLDRPAEAEADPPAPVTPPPPTPADAELRAARRHRASVTPEDHAQYSCSCGFQFEAAVTTSVACPHCGAGQAW